MDQKVSLDFLDEVLEGGIISGEPITFADPDFLTINHKDLASPCPTVGTDIGSSPSSPEQFVPNGHPTFTSPPESPVNVQFNFTGDQGTSAATAEDTTTILGAQDLFLSLMDAETSSSEAETTPAVVVTKSDTKKSAKARAKGVTKRTPKKSYKQVRVFEPSDRKQRKKGQNKTAATRYRQKKRVESETLHHEKTDLEDVNARLHSEVDKMSSEILYLKRLLREAFLTKGLLKNTDAAVVK